MKCLVYFMAMVVSCLGARADLKSIDESEITHKRVARNVLINTARRWPNNEVCYRFRPWWSPKYRAYIRDAMEYIENLTYVRFVEDTGGKRRDCAIIIPVAAGKGCSAHVGYLGKPQSIFLPNVELGSGCFTKFKLIHELLHTCGMYHQHSSHDRDKYVSIKWENIIPELFYAFARRSTSEATSFGLPYDYKSIMHYGRKKASKNGKDTIVSFNGAAIGQRMGMSEIDVQKMLLMYPKKIETTTVVSPARATRKGKQFKQKTKPNRKKS